MASISQDVVASPLDKFTLLTVQDQDVPNIPPHRSHDPDKSLKRCDPFKFGSRFLEAQDDVFEFNAWDHVETDDAFKEFAEQQYELQRQSPVSDFDKRLHIGSNTPDSNICGPPLTKSTDRFNSDPAKWWNLFYKNNTSNFFKDRKWLQQEFPVLSKIAEADAGPITVLEVGAGAGNTAFPLLANNQNPQLKVHACDFSKKAVEVMRNHESYDPEHIQADVWDVSSEALPPGLGESSVDVVIMIFIFSALSPSQWRQAVQNTHRVLKPGGEVCFRDYGRGDLAQVRFKKGRYLEENFYIRGDGTRVYFFEKDELAEIWAGEMPIADNGAQADMLSVEASPTPSPALFEVEQLGIDRRLLVNRAKRLKMYRCWMQGRFRKK